MLPSGRVFDTQLEFYLHASDLFKAALSTYHDVFFTQLALSVAAPGLDTSALWHNVIKGLTDLGQYEDAYTALISAPNERLYVQFCSIWSAVGRSLRVLISTLPGGETALVSSCTGCARSKQSINSSRSIS